MPPAAIRGSEYTHVLRPSGTSGSGKSTIARLLTNQRLPPSARGEHLEKSQSHNQRDRPGMLTLKSY